MRALLSLLVLASLALFLPTGGCISTSTGSGSSGGTCPCTVGNTGIQATIGCGESACLNLNGKQTGYHCTESGAVEDAAVCQATNTGGAAGTSGGAGAGSVGGSAGAGNSAGHAGAAVCVPKTCAELPLACGTPPDSCGGMLHCPACTGGLHCSPGGSCVTPAQNLIVIGNYQGGTFSINVDKHLPALGIGLVSYQPMTVNITGAYASDVVVVSHAGYQTGTQVTGVPPSIVSDVYLPSADGNPAHLIADDINMDPSKLDIEGYFKGIFGGGTLDFHQCQYKAYTNEQLVSVGGTCP